MENITNDLLENAVDVLKENDGATWAKKAYDFMKKKSDKFTDDGFMEVVDAKRGISIPMSKWTSVEKLVKQMYGTVKEDSQVDRIMAKFDKNKISPEISNKIQHFLKYIHDKKFELKDFQDSYIEKKIKDIICDFCFKKQIKFFNNVVFKLF